MLFHLLGDPISLHVGFSAEDPVAVRRQSTHRPALLARLAHLGVREGPFVKGSIRSTRHRDGKPLFLGIFDGIECLAWGLRHIGREHPGFYGRAP